MSTETQALKRSMPNQLAGSRQLSMLTRTQAQLSMSTRTQALNRSMPKKLARSQLSMPTRTQAQL